MIPNIFMNGGNEVFKFHDSKMQRQEKMTIASRTHSVPLYGEKALRDLNRYKGIREKVYAINGY
jgi:hypothetical protein